MAALMLSIFLLPTLYVWAAGANDVLPAVDPGLKRHNRQTAGRLSLGAAISRAWPAMTSPSSPIRSGFVQPHSWMDAGSCETRGHQKHKT